MLFLIAESTFYEKMINENTISFHSFEFIYSYTFLLTPNYFDISTIKIFHCPQVAVCQTISGNSHEDHTQNALLCRTNASNNRLPFFFYNPLGCIYVINNTRMWIFFTMDCSVLYDLEKGLCFNISFLFSSKSVSFLSF